MTKWGGMFIPQLVRIASSSDLCVDTKAKDFSRPTRLRCTARGTPTYTSTDTGRRWERFKYRKFHEALRGANNKINVSNARPFVSNPGPSPVSLNATDEPAMTIAQRVRFNPRIHELIATNTSPNIIEMKGNITVPAAATPSVSRNDAL